MVPRAALRDIILFIIARRDWFARKFPELTECDYYVKISLSYLFCSLIPVCKEEPYVFIDY